MGFLLSLFSIGHFFDGMGVNLGDAARHSEWERNARAHGARFHHRACRLHPGAARSQATRRRR